MLILHSDLARAETAVKKAGEKDRLAQIYLNISPEKNFRIQRNTPDFASDISVF